MIIEFEPYEPTGKTFLKNRSYLLNSTDNYIGSKPSKSFVYLFNSSLIGQRLIDTSDALGLDQEAYVQGTTVIWSRGGYIVESMDYSSEAQPILQIVFCKFAWPRFKDNNNKDNSNKDEQELRDEHKALCVVFRSHIIVCREDAPSVKCRLPFDIGQAVPLDVGLIISKNHHFETTKRPSLMPSEFAPSIATITNPLRDAYSVRIERVKSETSSTSLAYHQRVLFATNETSKTGRLPIVVTFDVKDKKHYIWTYKRLKTESKYRSSKRSSQILGKRPLDLIPNAARKRRDGKKEEGKLVESEEEEDVYSIFLDPSEVSLQILWSETPGKSVITELEKIQSSAFLVHNLSGEEMICIMNYSLNSLQLIHLDKAVDSENQCNVFKTSAKDAIPIYATRDKHIDLLILDVENNIRLLIDVSLHAITKIQLHFPATPTRLLHPVHDRLTVQYDNGQTIRYMLNLRPQSPLVRDCLIAIDCGSTISFPKIWIRFLELHFLSALETNMSEWASFTIALFSFLKIKRYEPWGREYEYKESTEKPIPAVWIERAIKENKGPNSLSMAALVEIIYTLHVVYEDYRIKKTTIHHARILGYLLLQLSVNLKNEEWIYYYKNQGFDTNLVHSLDIMKGETKVAISKPLDFQTCLRRMINSTLSEPVMNGFHGVHALKPAFLHYTDTYARTVKKLLSIYSVMKDMASNGKAIVNSIVDEGVTIEDIRMMYDVVASPILEVLDSLRTNPSLGWRVEAYRLIERNDVYKQLEIERKECDPNTDSFKLAFFEDSENRMDIGDIKMNQEIDQKHIYESDILNKKIAQLRFGLDKSIEKVRVMLDSTKAPDRYVTETPDLSDNDLAEKHQREVLMVTGRTITLSLGRCIYAFGTYIPDLTRDLPLEDMVFSAKIQPLRTIVQLDEEHITDEVLLWPKFHTGVAAGIRISPSNEVNESWINFCFPKSIEVEHGGILLGMGLTGVLKKLPVEYWYRFITSKCEQVMIGFILGACVNYIGTKQLNVTKILFIYIPSCVPGNDDAFEYSNQTIACNILGMGLVYMKSCDRSMLSIMFQELSRNAYSNASSFNSDYGSVSLAAGFAIGFIALGAGDQANLENLNLKSKLYKFLSARDNNYPKPPSPAHEHGATLALGLIYLKTENKKVADHLEVLETKHYLTLIRPDLMLIRVVAKNLIMWSTIEPTENWIDRQVPSFLLEPKDDIHEETAKQAMYSIIAGASLCIGLRFAGSKDDRAIQVILSRLNVFMRLAKASDATPSQKTTKSAIRTCINVLCTSAAMIAAGSGNPKVLRPLQELYDTLTPTTYYGSHMAISMSLGLLFVGLGGYTLKITDQAIAGLLCAFYPFYPIHSQDNDWHPQVFRHLWVIAADPRWVIPLDVDLNEPCSVPMQLEMYDGDKVHQIRIEAPAVLPDHSLIKSIQISDHRYWPLHVEEESVEYRDSIINSGVIYVKRKNSAPGDLVDFDF